MVRLLRVNGFEIAKGKLEVFPHPGSASLGMGLRLPLQEGFAWLDKATLDVEYDREFFSQGKALEFFIDALESDTNSFCAYRQMKLHIEDLESRRESAASIGRDEVSNVIDHREKRWRHEIITRTKLLKMMNADDPRLAAQKRLLALAQSHATAADQGD